jgi:hypothetical protein
LSLTIREEYRLRVLENRVLRRIVGPKRVEIRKDWRKLHIYELHNLYSSLNSIKIIRSRRMHGRDEKCLKLFCKGRDRLGGPSVGRIILKWILRT